MLFSRIADTTAHGCVDYGGVCFMFIIAIIKVCVDMVRSTHILYTLTVWYLNRKCVCVCVLGSQCYCCYQPVLQDDDMLNVTALGLAFIWNECFWFIFVCTSHCAFCIWRSGELFFFALQYTVNVMQVTSQITPTKRQ